MIYLLLLAPVLFNITGIIDTFLTKLFKRQENEWLIHNSIASLMIIWWVITLIVSLLLLPFVYKMFSTISVRSTITLIFAWVLYWLAARPYFKALYAEKIENIIPLLQTIPLFSYVFGFFLLWEAITTHQIVLMILIIFCTWLFSRNIHTKQRNIKWFLLAIGSSMLYGLSFVLFKQWWWESTHVWLAFFREHIGVTIASLTFALISKNRKSTYSYLMSKWLKFWILNISNELFYIIWIMIINFLSLLYPVAIINTMSNWLQPIIWFIMVRLAYKFLPSYFEWEYSKKELTRKILLCILCFWLLWYFFSISWL
jgi:uncharacterized membrane protein